MRIGIRRSRWLRVLAIFAIVSLILGSNLSAITQDVKAAPSTKTVSWDDVTPTAKYRNFGDWLVGMGQATPEEIYGPFKGKQYQEGDTERFYALDFDVSTGRGKQIRAELRKVTEHAYWWFEVGTDTDPAELDAAAQRFEQDIYPLDRAVYGDVWTPGIDGDPHIFLLHQKKIGGFAVGVFSPWDECPRRLCQGSNQHEMLYIGLDAGPVNSVQNLTTIAHELQHLIQYNTSGNKQRWMDEGLAQLAEHLNGFDPREIRLSDLRKYLRATNFQLDSWPETFQDDPSINYAVSYMFFVYLYQRFGTAFITHMSGSQQRGLAAVEEALKAMNTGTTLDEVFADWAVANYVNNPYVGDGRYYYQSLKLPEKVGAGDFSPAGSTAGNLHEYGASYYQVKGDTSYTLSFKGDLTVPLTKTKPTSGSWMWWGYNETLGIARLEREFDLTDVTDPQLTYQAYWRIPTDQTWADVVVSTDDGATWKMLDATNTQSCSVANGGPCYTNSQSDGWQEETVDLSEFAGQKIHLRFEYVTSGDRLGDGFFIDDITLDAINYKDDAESADGGWAQQGFIRLQRTVPQYWAVTVISRDTLPQVIPVALDAKNIGKLTFTTPKDGAVVVVAAMAPFVQAQAKFTLSIKKS